MADLWVFDFDGTLVETAAIKRTTFFEVFPDRHAPAVEAALQLWPDASRHEVIPRMVETANDPTLDPDALVAAYGATVVERVRQAPAIQGAEDALIRAAQQGVACVFSMSPHDELVAALHARGWAQWLSDVCGYPAHKPDTLNGWITRFDAKTTTVIGDGPSDAEAAHLNNARFLHAQPGWPELLFADTPS